VNDIFLTLRLDVLADLRFRTELHVAVVDAADGEMATIAFETRTADEALTVG